MKDASSTRVRLASRCPVCGDEIRPGESVGNVDGKPAHVTCWLERRAVERADRDPDR